MKSKLALAAVALAMITGVSGLAAAQDGHYYDRDDRYSDRDDRGYNRNHDSDDYRYENRYNDGDDNFRRGQHVARDLGFRDGAEVARADLSRGKRFNPNPRGRYDDADHGYRREFGDKHEYREHYIDAYRNGYQETFRDGGYYR